MKRYQLNQALYTFYSLADKISGIMPHHLITIGGASLVFQDIIKAEETNDIDILVTNENSFKIITPALLKRGYIRTEKEGASFDSDGHSLNLKGIGGEIGTKSLFGLIEQMNSYRMIKLKTIICRPTFSYFRPAVLIYDDYKLKCREEQKHGLPIGKYLDRMDRISNSLPNFSI